MVAFSLTREPLFSKPSLSLSWKRSLYPFLPYPGLVIQNRRLYGLVYGRWKSEGPADWVHLAFSFYCRQLNVIFFISLFVPFPLYTLPSFFACFYFFGFFNRFSAEILIFARVPGFHNPWPFKLHIVTLIMGPRRILRESGKSEPSFPSQFLFFLVAF